MRKIIISDTEEHDEYDSLSSMAIFTIESDNAYRLSVIATALKRNHPNFSEYREWGSYTQFFTCGSPEDILEELKNTVEPDGMLTTDEFDRIKDNYDKHRCFVLPESCWALIESIEDNSCNNAISIDIEEVSIDIDSIRGCSYSCNTPIYTKPIPVDWVCE